MAPWALVMMLGVSVAFVLLMRFDGCLGEGQVTGVLCLCLCAHRTRKLCVASYGEIHHDPFCEEVAAAGGSCVVLVVVVVRVVIEEG